MRRVFWLGVIICGLVLAQSSVSLADNWWGGRSEKVRGSGTKGEETRTVEGIEEVEYGTIGTLYISIGDKEELTITGDDNLLEYIETDVAGRTLIIDTDRDYSLRTRQPLRFYLTVKSLRAIEIGSSGDVQVEDDLTAKRFRIRSQSSGDLRMMALECDEVDIDLSSSGDVEIERLTAKMLGVEIGSSGDLLIRGGAVKEQGITIESSGDYKARDLASETTYVETSSSGDAFVRVSEYLDAETSSSGDINYYGSPRVRLDENSSGDIRCAGR